MRVFVTGATGFIGSAVVKELLASGHQVVGLARSKDKAAALASSGADVMHGSVNDPDVLGRGVAGSDGVIHLAFNHDFSRYAANCEDDRLVIETLGAALLGSDRPLIVTSGTAMANSASGQFAVEDYVAASSKGHPRAASEEAAISAAEKGVNASIVRLPQVHNIFRAGLITYAIAIAREKKVAAYVGDGHNRWPAGHLLDVARLYRLALEKSERGARYHAVAEEGVPLRDIADVIGRRLQMPAVSIAPQEAAAHFGWLSLFASLDMPASSAQTRKRLGWQPTQRGLIEDLEQWTDEATLAAL